MKHQTWGNGWPSDMSPLNFLIFVPPGISVTHLESPGVPLDATDKGQKHGSWTHADGGRPHLSEAETQRLQLGIGRPQTVDAEPPPDHVEVVGELVSDGVDNQRRGVGGVSVVGADSADSDIGVCAYYHHARPRQQLPRVAFTRPHNHYRYD